MLDFMDCLSVVVAALTESRTDSLPLWGQCQDAP